MAFKLLLYGSPELPSQKSQLSFSQENTKKMNK
uniref:Uncharacterized protein n=1 Tax=Rhizophora mucronata TaxID=61149 RepID=A0A2P2IN46_RHIMU